MDSKNLVHGWPKDFDHASSLAAWTGLCYGNCNCREVKMSIAARDFALGLDKHCTVMSISGFEQAQLVDLIDVQDVATVDKDQVTEEQLTWVGQ